MLAHGLRMLQNAMLAWVAERGVMVPYTMGDLIDGHYRVEKRYAGGMGFVYVVRDEVVGKRFAIKQLPELQAENKVLAERFRREASAWLLLDYHPNIVQAH